MRRQIDCCKRGTILEGIRAYTQLFGKNRSDWFKGDRREIRTAGKAIRTYTAGYAVETIFLIIYLNISHAIGNLDFRQSSTILESITAQYEPRASVRHEINFGQL